MYELKIYRNIQHIVTSDYLYGIKLKSSTPYCLNICDSFIHSTNMKHLQCAE